MPIKIRDVFSMPPVGPLYSKYVEKGYFYQDATFAMVIYETDADAVMEILPEGLEPAHNPPRCDIWAAYYPYVGFGKYGEAFVRVFVKHENKEYGYCPWIFYDQAGGTVLAAARELYGWPAKLAKCHLEYTDEHVIGYAERPHGKRICTVTVFPEATAKPEELGAGVSSILLRVIPSVRPGGRPDALQFVESPFTVTSIKTLMKGRGSVTYDSPSEEDPWYKLRPNKILSAYYIICDIDYPRGRIVKDFLRPK